MYSCEKFDVEANPEPSKRIAARDTVDVESNTSKEKRRTRVSAASMWRRMFVKVDARIISDAILGLSDGMTVPFALAAGLTAFGTTRIVIIGGLAELVAGAISMGLGGYLGARSIFESYQATERKCDTLIETSPAETTLIVRSCMLRCHAQEREATMISVRLHESAADLKDFLMRHHFEAAQPETSRPYISALTLGAAYFIGGFIPLVPYFIVPNDEVLLGLWWSIGIMVVVLLVFGYTKTCVVRGWRGRQNCIAGGVGALQMLAVGTLAVGAAVGLVKAIEQGHRY